MALFNFMVIDDFFHNSEEKHLRTLFLNTLIFKSSRRELL